MGILSKEGQNIFDIAVQEFGGVEGVFQLIKDNPAQLADINSFVPSQTELEINLEAVVDENIRGQFGAVSKDITTGDQPVGDFNEDFNEDFN